jgi:hypothetical protein
MKVKKFIISLAACCLLLSGYAGSSFAQSSVPADDSQWSYDLQLYLLVLWISGDSEMGRISQSFDVDVTPHDIFSNLDMGGMAHFEAHRKQGLGVWLDYAFMDLSKSAEFGSEGFIRNQLGVYQGVMEAFATYRTPLAKGYIDYFAGARWWHNDFDYTVTVLDSHKTSRTIDWCDPIIGLRWTRPVSERWDVRARADVGGFSLASDFTSAVELGAIYDVSDNWKLDMRIKSMWVNYDDGKKGTPGRFTYNTVNYGPIIGMTYSF